MQAHIFDKKVRNGQKQEDDVKRERSIKREQVLLTERSSSLCHFIARTEREPKKCIAISSCPSAAQRKSKEIRSAEHMLLVGSIIHSIVAERESDSFLCSARCVGALVVLRCISLSIGGSMIAEVNQICKCDRYKAQLDVILNTQPFHFL